MKFKIHTNNRSQGGEVEVDINMEMQREVERTNAGSVLHLLDARYQVAEGQPLPSQQVAVQMGLNRNPTMMNAYDGEFYCGPQGKAASVSDGSAVGRLVTQATLMQAIERSLREDLTGYSAMLNSNAALRTSINSTRFEQPVLDFRRPAAGRPQAIAQLAEPTRMLLMTTGMRGLAILGESIGIEYSDAVARDITIDIVNLSLRRQAEESAAARAMYFIMSFLNGDVDVNMKPLAQVPGAVKTAVSLDPAATSGITQVAWVKWLFEGNLKRTITTIVTDLNGAMAIENRKGRPLVESNFGTSKRIDTMESILNPRWPDKVDVIITQDPDWPANTAVGFDKRYGYHLVNSTVLDYKATEELAMRRSTKMRFDSGQIAYRYIDEAWSVLTWAN